MWQREDVFLWHNTNKKEKRKLEYFLKYEQLCWAMQKGWKITWHQRVQFWDRFGSERVKLGIEDNRWPFNPQMAKLRIDYSGFGMLWETATFCVFKTRKLTPILAFFCLSLLWLFTEDSDWLLYVHACNWEVHRCFLLFYAISCSFVLFCVVFKRRVKICNKKLRKTASDQQ